MILNEIVQEHSTKIIELIQEHRIGPELQLHEFDSYTSLFNNEAQQYVEEFLSADPPHTFEEYDELIQKYDELSKKIPLEFERIVFTGLFEVHRKEFLDYLAENAKALRDELLNKMVMDYQYKSRA